MISQNLSKEVRKKLEWFDYYKKHGKNARRTCRHFGISPDTFYRWKKRYDPNNLSSLEDNKKNRRPKKLREPTTPARIMNRVKELKEKNPKWGRNKLSRVLKNEGVTISVSTVGRIIIRLKKSGVLSERVDRMSDKRKGSAALDSYESPTGYHEYLSLLELWGKTS